MMVEMRDDGLARSIGVSNFLRPHLDELLADTPVEPAVNQIELSPLIYRSRHDTVERSRETGITLAAYSPLTKGARLDDPRLVDAATRTGRTPVQVLIRWAIEHGFIVLPRSSNPERIAQNAAVFNFELAPDQMASLDELDEGLVTGWDPAVTLDP